MCKPVRYYADMVLAPLLATTLALLTPEVSLAAVGCGALVWSLGEYGVHRWLLHRRGGSDAHIDHHRVPQETVTDTAWQVYAIIALSVLANPSFGIGVLASYAWYIYVHHCCHHFHRGIPASLLSHHDLHHKYAMRNFGVGTTLWDHLLRTNLPCSTN